MGEAVHGGWLQGWLEPDTRVGYASAGGVFRTLDGVVFSDVALYDPLVSNCTPSVELDTSGS